MKNQKISDAYGRIAPDNEPYDRILDAVVQRAAAEAPPRNRTLRRIALVAACLALLAGVGGVGYAAYQRWSLPEPTVYPFSGQGSTQIHTTADYTDEDIPADPTERSDAYFMAQAVAQLEAVGLTDVDTAQLRVTRQRNLYWAREEVEVAFAQGQPSTTVTYDAQNGQLLALSGIDWQEEGSAACETLEAAQALAAHYYAALPVPQGYELRGHTAYDEQYWSFEFCRKVAQDLYNSYEMVRIGLNPQSGRLCGVNVFCVPLLDDHEPGDVPLSQAEAEAVVQDKLDRSRYTLQKADVQVVLPNWMFTDQKATGELQASNVTRLGWLLEYEDTSSEFCDKIYFMVDYYTGELLGGDRT